MVKGRDLNPRSTAHEPGELVFPDSCWPLFSALHSPTLSLQNLHIYSPPFGPSESVHLASLHAASLNMWEWNQSPDLIMTVDVTMWRYINKWGYCWGTNWQERGSCSTIKKISSHCGFLRTHEEPSALKWPEVCSNERHVCFMPSFQMQCLHKQTARIKDWIDKASELQNRANSAGVFFPLTGWQRARDVRRAACLVSAPHLDNSSVERGMRPRKKNNQHTRGGALGQRRVCV